MTGLFSTPALAIAFTGLAASGGCLALALGCRSPTSLVLGTYVLGWGQLVLVSLVLSLADALTPRALALALAVCLAASIGAWRLRGSQRSPAFRSSLASARDAVRDPPVGVLAVIVGLGLLYSAALLLFTAQNEGDALSYHIPRMLLWRQQHAIGYLANVVDLRLNVNPPNAEIGQLATVLVSGSDRFVGLPEFVALLASMVAVGGIALRLGLTVRGAVLSALLLATYPVFILQSSGALNDLVVCSFVVCAAYFVLCSTPSATALAALAVALAAGAKFSAVYGIALILAAVLLSGGRRRLPAVIAIAAGAVVGSYWIHPQSGREGVVGRRARAELRPDVEPLGPRDRGDGLPPRNRSPRPERRCGQRRGDLCDRCTGVGHDRGRAQVATGVASESPARSGDRHSGAGGHAGDRPAGICLLSRFLARPRASQHR